MRQERWDQLEALFNEALLRPEPARAAWLAQACGDDADLRRELEALLRAHAQSGVLDTPPFVVETPATGGERSDGVAASLASGAQLGAWRIERLIGRGGMGEVYAARRVEATFTQRGALKLLRFEAIGELARFHAERQILARLDHPGIARLLDGGVAQDGRPYTVMEYVDGVSLIEYCATRRATLSERLALFGQVCSAVAYAHRNLVIHRDLKPGNTLVDDDGKVKLLDFGIAKLLDADTMRGNDAPTMTFAPFTPDYAAPEQLAGETVTTATDIYALGVLLFELLTGERPLRTQGLPFAHVLARLNDRAAPPASRVAQASAQAPLPASALAGDLDAIVAKCLRREPSQRYETVNALQEDLQRHLAHAPVRAREGARLYVFSRLLRRYRWGAAAVVALVLALSAGLAGTLWQAHKAQVQARTADAVQDFVGDLFRANSSKQKDPVKARATTARELLDIGAAKIDTDMADAPAAKLAVLNLLGDLYGDLALREEQVQLRSKAVEITRSIDGADSYELVTALTALAGAMHGSKEEAKREPVLREALAILDRKGDVTSVARGLLLQKFAESYEVSDQAKALDYAQQSLAALKAYPPSGDLAESWYLQGLMQTYLGRNEEAVVSLQNAAAMSRAAEGDPNAHLIFIEYQLADTQRRLHDLAGAEHNARQTLADALAVNGEDHIDAVRARLMLGNVLVDSGRIADGLVLLEQAKHDVLRIAGLDNAFHTPAVLEAIGLLESESGDVAAGLADLESTAAIRRRFEGDSVGVANLDASIGFDMLDLGRVDDARHVIEGAEAICVTHDCAHGKAVYNVRILNTIIIAHFRLAMAQARWDDARAQLERLVIAPNSKMGHRAQFTRWVGEAELAMEGGNAAADVSAPLAKARAETTQGFLANPPVSSAIVDELEGESAMRRGDAAAALPPLERALAARQKLLLPPNLHLAETQTWLAASQLALGHVKEASELAAAAAAIEAHYPRVADRYRKPLESVQRQLPASAQAAFAPPAPRTPQ